MLEDIALEYNIAIAISVFLSDELYEVPDLSHDFLALQEVTYIQHEPVNACVLLKHYQSEEQRNTQEK